MDAGERKRPFDEVENPHFERSKKPLLRLTEDGPLAQLDVVYYKKEAIWRQMRYYKQQVYDLQRDLASSERRVRAFTASHSLLEAWISLVFGIFGEKSEEAASNGKHADVLDLSLSEDEFRDLLDKRRKKLTQLLENSSPLSNDAVSKFLESQNSLAAQKAAEALYSNLQTKVIDILEELDALRRERDRLNSKSIERVAANSHAKQEQPAAEEPKDDKAKFSEGSEISEAQKQELENLQIQLTELKAGYSSVENRLRLTTEKLTQVEQVSADLKARLEDLTEDDLKRSTRYLSLVDRTSQLSENVSQLTKVKDDLLARLKDYETNEANISKLIAKELEEDVNRLRENLAKAESDLVRVRAVRDELLAKQTLLKLEFDNRKTNEDLVKMNELLNDRILTLESNRHKEDEKDMSDLDLVDKAELIKRHNILHSELKDIEAAFQQTRQLMLDKAKDTVDREGLMKKLTIEKNKADQKYFASMRLKDLLLAENKVLKSQVSKSQEFVNKLTDLEKNYLAKIDLLTKSVDDYRAIKEGSIHETLKMQEAFKQMGKSRELMGKELKQAKEEMLRLSKEKAETKAELDASQTKESKLEARLRATDSLLLKYKQNNTSSILQEDEKQLEALRSITKCSVCLKNWKNTAITACGHVFCDGCVQERLAARLRRCPTCNKGFSSNDLLSIHL